MRVLLIDDDGSVRRFARAALERAGHEVAEAAGGREGLALYGGVSPDVVVCDLFMPEVDGMEVLRGLVGRFPRVRVVVASGGAGGGDYDLTPVALALGAVAAIRKPFRVADLVAAVEAAADHR